VRTSALGEAALADSPLTLPRLGLLESVSARPGITIAEIARRAPQTQQALSQIAARLDKLGFIERRPAGGGAASACTSPPPARAPGRRRTRSSRHSRPSWRARSARRGTGA
jgi:hypothetical protein